MGRLDRLFIASQVVNTLAQAGTAVFDRLKQVRDLSEKVERLEKELQELKEKKC